MTDPSHLAFLALLLAVGLERIAELRVSNDHAAQAFSRGGVEHGRGHYPSMVVLHGALLLGAGVESVLLDRPTPVALVVPTMVLVVAAQALRWWCIRSLGWQWNTRVIVVPGAGRVQGGPYRWLSHPNYVAVVVEGLALPLVGGAWVTAVAFTALNAWVLLVRIRAENSALASLGEEVPA